MAAPSDIDVSGRLEVTPARRMDLRSPGAERAKFGGVDGRRLLQKHSRRATTLIVQLPAKERMLTWGYVNVDQLLRDQDLEQYREPGHRKII